MNFDKDFDEILAAYTKAGVEFMIAGRPKDKIDIEELHKIIQLRKD